jgi:hypothetical protein
VGFVVNAVTRGQTFLQVRWFFCVNIVVWFVFCVGTACWYVHIRVLVTLFRAFLWDPSCCLDAFVSLCASCKF